MRAAGLKYGSQPCDTPIMLTMRNATITSHTRKVRLLVQRGWAVRGPRNRQGRPVRR